MQTVAITADANRLILTAPYDPTMPAKAKAIGGKWSPDRKAWTFDPRDEQRVRELAREVYGTDGSEATQDEPGLTVRYTFGLSGYAYREQELRIAGQRLAWRPYRDGDVRLGDGVVVVSGRFDGSGGSMKNPRLADTAKNVAGLVLEVRDVPRSVAEKMRAEQPAHITIVETTDERRTALEAERERLLARLAEIDAELNA